MEVLFVKKYRSALQTFGSILLIISIIAFIVSMILCYIGETKGIISIFISLFLFLIGYNAYNKGKIQTEKHFGNDNNKDEDENIYKDTLKKD